MWEAPAYLGGCLVRQQHICQVGGNKVLSRYIYLADCGCIFGMASSAQGMITRVSVGTKPSVSTKECSFWGRLSTLVREDWGEGVQQVFIYVGLL